MDQHSWHPRQRTTWSRRVTSDFDFHSVLPLIRTSSPVVSGIGTSPFLKVKWNKKKKNNLFVTHARQVAVVMAHSSPMRVAVHMWSPPCVCNEAIHGHSASTLPLSSSKTTAWLPQSAGNVKKSTIHWAAKEIYHFVRTTLVKIHCIKTNHSQADDRTAVTASFCPSFLR